MSTKSPLTVVKYNDINGRLLIFLMDNFNVVIDDEYYATRNRIHEVYLIN